MDTFAILGFVFGTVGFVFALSSLGQISELGKRIKILEDKINNSTEGDENNDTK